jgi:hypothetical protein
MLASTKLTQEHRLSLHEVVEQARTTCMARQDESPPYKVLGFDVVDNERLMYETKT